MSTSPTAKYFPSGLNDTHVAALTRSLAIHDLFPGESAQSPPGVDAPMPASLKDAAVLLRQSVAALAGDGRSYTDAVGFDGDAVGRARKNRCDTWWVSSTAAMTAAAPAVKAKHRADGRISKALAEFVVVPMTCFSDRPSSCLFDLAGGLTDAFFVKGELDGVSLEPQVGFIILTFEGVSDISRTREVEEGGSSA